MIYYDIDEVTRHKLDVMYARKKRAFLSISMLRLL